MSLWLGILQFYPFLGQLLLHQEHHLLRYESGQVRSIQQRIVYPFSRCFDKACEEVRDLYGQQQHMHVEPLFHRSLQSDHRMDVGKSYRLRYGQMAYLSVLTHKPLVALHAS